MCGRFVRDLPPDLQLAVLVFLKTGVASGALVESLIGEGPTWNAAPTQRHPVLRTDTTSGLAVATMRWGWRRSFTKALLVNAVGEEAWAKRTWRDAFLARRCAVPMSAFYEWTPRAVTGAALPWAFARADRSPFLVAGLWEHAAPDAGGAEDRFVLLTTPANQVVGRVHHRMAAMLAPEGAAEWLDPATSEERARGLLTPFPGELTASWRVSPLVNSVKNNRRELAEAVPE